MGKNTNMINKETLDIQDYIKTFDLRNIEDPVKISVIIPTLNEADNLQFVLPLIPRWVDEIILVDGNSTDGTITVAKGLCPDLRVISQKGQGKGDALITGFKAAKGDILVTLDADCSMDPREIPRFIGALLSGADFATGTRFIQGGGTDDMPFYRKIGCWVFRLLVRLMFGGIQTDVTYGYNSFWRSKLPQLDLDAEGFEIEPMMNIRALRAGLVVVEIPSFEAKRKYGVAKLRTFPDGLRCLITIFSESVSHIKTTMAEALNNQT